MRYLDMPAEQLREHYWQERDRLANIGTLARSISAPRGRRMLAGQTGSALERFDLIIACARKRGIELVK